jgi:benzoyl-CoA reductase/2-hydroxyglutaryl-CoA dehydratase subunit BcrC/BadD/HgdB
MEHRTTDAGKVADKTLEELQAEVEAFAMKAKAKLDEAIRNGDPILGGLNQITPEVCTALDLANWFTANFHMQAVQSEKGPEYIDASTALVSSTFMCSFIRTGVYQLEAGVYPKPTMLVAGTSPCDANVMLGQMMFNYEPWADVPKFVIDVPYRQDEYGIAYFAKQARDLAAFVEKHSGRKLDMDRLKEVCEESNEAYRTMLEIQELKRSVPAPLSWRWGNNCYTVARIFAPGQPEATEWLRRLLEITERRVKEKRGIDGLTEKIRLLWFDLFPVWAPKLFSALEREFGAVIAMDIFSPPWALVDTSSEESMFRSFVSKYVGENPMTRPVMGTMDMCCDDIVRSVRDYKIDAVILPTHAGHKNMNAAVKIAKDLCRDLGVPFLSIGADMFDERYMSADEVMEKISRLFYATGLA